MKVLDAVTLTLATARLAMLVAQDEITEPLRQKVDAFAKDAEYGSLPERLSYLVSCTKCTSIWASAAVLLLWRFPAGQTIVRLLAGSQAAITTLAALEWLEED